MMEFLHYFMTYLYQPMGSTVPPGGTPGTHPSLLQTEAELSASLGPTARMRTPSASRGRLGIRFLPFLFLDRATPPNPSHPVVAEEHLAFPHEAPLGPGRGRTRMWSRSRPAGTRWRGGARRRARGLREAGPGAPAPAARRPLAPLPIAEPAPGRPGPSERPGAAEGRRLAWHPAALAAAPGRASPGPPRSRPGESEVCWRPSL